MKKSILVLFSLFLCVPFLSYAQVEVVTDSITLNKAEVVQVTNEQVITIPGTDTVSRTQTLQARILEGVEAGSLVTFDNDYTQLVVGDVFYLRHMSNALDDTSFYSVADHYRIPILLWLLVAFLLLLVLFGGIQGIRGLLSLCGSLFLIFYLLLPGILQGYSPVLVSVGVASLVVVIGSYITHGFNKTTTTAVMGMIGAVVTTGLGAYYVVDAAHLTGYVSEETVYLNFDTGGSVNMVGLLFGGIIIGLLGVLYDIAIGQAIAVEELYRAGQHLSRIEVYKRAIRIGREHIGALVNTLAIAYVGVSLPLLLLIQNSSTVSVPSIINTEMFATEIIRILIGSMGLIIAVPITTAIAAYMLTHKSGDTQAMLHRH